MNIPKNVYLYVKICVTYVEKQTLKEQLWCLICQRAEHSLPFNLTVVNMYMMCIDNTY